ncbi:alpha/beta hydrolase [Pseudomonas sp. ZM23]|uniref:Alpha/beta hydrolase n=1 Tax=Pseudomonas triclosanedens TaxID=2961893 RepID=A0ABY6ZYB5_9PSED|nr:alpha/beta hydrolase [Pseudomonas triclosanedens]MCP8462663.1 alpha/beta hydrolase [Pseudomonas triclosanedens]MCP8468282.1 alpha/beta hydrolase [Pseudomonas triclosanedens]MCP8475041.1 alpha/beta hydrolase [Pseudomonas triclosanedens]WAI49851.1 alpha/beta hydrolase [Pseudomonas triclosanedens]
MRNERTRYLIVPGWHGSEDDHWQSHWQRALPNAARVEQSDWIAPQRADWIAELERAIRRDSGRVVLIAHSLGCVTVAAWAAQADRRTLAQVAGALLVAPADVERETCHEALRNFAPIARQTLPFPSVLVGSDNDQACAPQRALALGRCWGAETVILPSAGHINVKSGHGAWDSGYRHLFRLQYLIDLQSRRRA